MATSLFLKKKRKKTFTNHENNSNFMNPMLSIQVDDDVFQDWKGLQQSLLTALQMQEELSRFNDIPLHSTPLRLPATTQFN